MSKSTAKVAQAISLLSDVLSSEVECEVDEVTETVDSDEYDELKDQAVTYGEIVDSDLSIISRDLERVLDLAEDIDGETTGNDNYSWNADTGTSTAGDDDENIEAPQGNRFGDTDSDNAESLVSDASRGVADLEEKNAELEKKNEELTDKIEDLTDTIRSASAMIESSIAINDGFLTEVKSL
jgi:hypothetical protein